MNIVRAPAASLITLALRCIALLGAGAGSAHAQQQPLAPERPLVFVPGLLGSMLCRPGPQGEQVVVWGTVEAMGQFPTLALDPAANDIEPCGLIREISFLGIFSQTVYGPFIDRLEKAGYREGETLFIFDYDWRLSVFDNARRLADLIDEKIPGAGAIDIVAHSMGGLIARTYALEEGGAARIGRLVSAGTPWRGSVQVFELLHGGWGLANVLLGGLDTFRRTAISFPSTFEMIPHYEGCCADSQPGAPAFEATSLDAWLALNWAGIDRDALPDLAGVEARQARLRDIVAAPLPAHIEEAFAVGVDQRTSQQYDLQFGDGEARLAVRTSWEGDGTVMRDSALLEERVTYPTSFATHDAILNDALVQDFVIAALADGPEVAVETVPVRERTSILTALGTLVELIGVAIEMDQPVYRAGALARANVHLRLAVDEPVEATAIRMTVAAPGGPATEVPLTPSPQASDPSNPFEQSFSAQFETGAVAGELTVTVSLEGTGAAPRVVTRVVPILAP